MVYDSSGEEEAKFICAARGADVFVTYCPRDCGLMDLTDDCDLRHRERLEIVDVAGLEELRLKIYDSL